MVTPEDSPSEAEQNSVLESSYSLRLGDNLEFVEFDHQNFRLTYFHSLGATRQIGLGFSEALLLECLIKNPGVVLSRQELIDHAWKDRVVTQGSLNQAISNLRLLLSDDQRREIIVTIPRRGYQFNADFLMDWQDWMKRKEKIIHPIVEANIERKPNKSNSTIEKNKPLLEKWKLPMLVGSATLLAALLLAGIFSRFFYTLWPPYAIENIESPNLKLVLISKNQSELISARELISPLLKRMEALGGGQILANKKNTYFEVNCLRADSSIYSMFLDFKRIQSIEDSHIVKCLK